MDLFEYQGKQFFARYGIPVSDGASPRRSTRRWRSADRIGYPVVVKAQVQVGGRGKAGGMKLANDADEADARRQHPRPGHQGPRGQDRLDRDTCDIAQEYYACFTLDRARRSATSACSRRRAVWRSSRSRRSTRRDRRHRGRPGGRPRRGAVPRVGRPPRSSTRRPPRRRRHPPEALPLYVEGDADLVEINPLILTPDGRVHALDAKVTLDDNARVPSPRLGRLTGPGARRHRERGPREGSAYVGLEGSVGMIANGAGLAMAPSTSSHQVGGEPANFLDIGGGANADVMAGALEVINNDPKVKSIFINIFGGITKGEEVANGIVQALGRVDIESPSSSASTAPTPRRAARSSAAPVRQAREQADHARGRPAAVAVANGMPHVSIFVDENTKVVYQGLTGGQGRFYGLRNRDYGTQVVARHQPQEGRHRRGRHPRVRAPWPTPWPSTGATASCIFIPAPRRALRRCSRPPRPASSSSWLITEGVPAHDEACVLQPLKRDFPRIAHPRPNCPGMHQPGQVQHRHHRRRDRQARWSGRHRQPLGHAHLPGALRAAAQDIGVTTCVGIGGDPVPGTSFIDCLRAVRGRPARPRR